jgi:hypothetical protein
VGALRRQACFIPYAQRADAAAGCREARIPVIATRPEVQIWPSLLVGTQRRAAAAARAVRYARKPRMSGEKGLWQNTLADAEVLSS